MKLLPILVIILLMSSCSRGGADGRTAATGEWAADSSELWMRPAVEVVAVRSGMLVDSVQSTGILAGAREVRLLTETQGVVREIGFELGERVMEGQVLLRFDDRQERFAMQQAREELEAARLDLVAIERLAERGSASRLDLSRARAAVEGAGARYEGARRSFEARTVRAPFEGLIASRPPDLELGNYLSNGSLVARVVDLDRVRVDLSLGEREVMLISRGAAAEVTLQACAEPIRNAVVSAVAAGAEPTTGSYSVRVTWENECGDAIRAGMAVSVRIEAQNGASGIIIPTSALLRERNTQYAFVVGEDDRVERRDLELGRRFADRALVRTGLSEGERVVVSGLSRLRDGVTVQASAVDVPNIQ